LGNGYLAADIRLNVRQIGIEWQPRPGLGWRHGYLLSLARIDSDLTSHLRLDYFPIGNFKSYTQQLQLRTAKLLLGGFEFGYHGRRWSISYQMQQPIPLQVEYHERAEDRVSSDGGGGGGGGDGGSSGESPSSSVTDRLPRVSWRQIEQHLRRLPAANRQRILFSWRF
jgi:hypothetical protein